MTAAAAAAATTLTIAGVDTNAWADNDYLIVGEIGSDNAEIMQANGAVSDGTSLTIDRSGAAGGLRFAHSIGEPVYRIDYNRVEFNRNTTDSTSGVTVLTTIEIQPDDEFTRYEDTANTTGYGFVRFNNQTTGAFSSYSDGVNYEATGISSSRDPRTLFAMRKKVRDLLDEKDSAKLSDAQIDDALNAKQREVAHKRLFPFLEAERSFSSVANQFSYTIPVTVQKMHALRFDTQPLVPIDKNRWDLLHFDTNTSSADPSHFAIWNGEIIVYPRPSSAADTTTINQVGGISASDTSVTVTSTAAFNRGDYFRFIIDNEVIYATASTVTSFTGLLRGREGTTAAAHANAATITERNIVYTAHVEPTLLIDSQDRTPIPEPDVLVYGAASDLALLLNKETLRDRLLAQFEKTVKDLESNYSAKQSGHFGRVKSADETNNIERFMHPNLYPSSINT